MVDIQGELATALAKYLAIIEPAGYSPEEFERAEPETSMGKIKKSGKILYAA